MEKQLRTPRNIDTKKTAISPKKRLTVIIACAAAVLLILAGCGLWTVLSRFTPKVSAQHELLNSLPDNIYPAIIKENILYICKDGQTLPVGNTVGTAGISAMSVAYNGEKLYYIGEPDTQRILYEYSDGQSRELVRNVSTFTVSADFKRVAVVINANSSGLNGTLMLFDGKDMKLLTGMIKAQSVIFSMDGSKLFALSGSGTDGDLYMYDEQGSATLLRSDIYALGWVSPDGSSYMTGKSYGNTYTYNFFSTDGKKSLSIDGINYSYATNDGAIVYLLCDYDETKGYGRLVAVDTAGLKEYQISGKTAMFNPSAVTNAAEGMVYSEPSDMDDRFDIMYFEVSSNKRYRIAKQAGESTLSTVSINTGKQKGYVVSWGDGANTALYSLDFTSGLTARSVNEGSICELMYYEAPDKAIYSSEGSGNHVAITVCDGTQYTRLLNTCGAVYDSEYNSWASCSLLSNDGEQLLFFKNVVEPGEDDPLAACGAELYGNLLLQDIQTGTLTSVADNVLADSFDCVVADGALKNIYFSVLTPGGLFDIYCYNRESGAKTLVMEGASALLNYREIQ